MPKRKKGEGGGSIEMESGGMMRWLLTYADMITLMLALFVIMYALAADSNAARIQEVAAQFRAVFGVVTGGSTIMPSEGTNQGIHFKVVAGEPEEGGSGGPKKPGGSTGTNPAADEIHNGTGLETGGKPTKKDIEIAAKLKAALSQALGAQKVSIRREARGLVVSLLTDKVLFDLGDVRLKNEMRQILGDIAGVIKQYPDRQIVVEGHTDDLPMRTDKIPSNWELSALRSTSVVRYFIEEKGLDPSRLSAAGYGEFQPLVPNVSEANRRTNRRVDIVIMKLD
jgi:chemotaxis protein MotB